MAVLKALKRSPGAFWGNPVIALPIIALVLLQTPSFAAEFLDPFLAMVLSVGVSVIFVFLVPYFQGGVIGMADEALDESTSIGTFHTAGTSNYVSIFGAYLMLIAINVVLGIGILLVIVLGLGAAYFGGNASVGGVSFVFLAAFGILVALGYLLFNFFIQFYPQSIVIDDYGAIGGLKHSIGVVRRNVLASVGYSLVAGGIGIGFGILAGVISIFASPNSMATLATETPPLTWFIAFGIIGGLLSVILGTFMAIFSVSFYRVITEEDGSKQRPTPDL